MFSSGTFTLPLPGRAIRFQITAFSRDLGIIALSSILDGRRGCSTTLPIAGLVLGMLGKVATLPSPAG
jgi:hypothetical protein